MIYFAEQETVQKEKYCLDEMYSQLLKTWVHVRKKLPKIHKMYLYEDEEKLKLLLRKPQIK